MAVQQLILDGEELRGRMPRRTQDDVSLQLGKPQRSMLGQRMIRRTDNGNGDLAKLPKGDGRISDIFQDAE